MSILLCVQKIVDICILRQNVVSSSSTGALTLDLFRFTVVFMLKLTWARESDRTFTVIMVEVD